MNCEANSQQPPTDLGPSLDRQTCATCTTISGVTELTDSDARLASVISEAAGSVPRGALPRWGAPTNREILRVWWLCARGAFRGSWGQGADVEGMDTKAQAIR